MTRAKERMLKWKADEGVSIEPPVTAHEAVPPVQMMAAAMGMAPMQMHCGLLIEPSCHRDGRHAWDPAHTAMSEPAVEWRVSWRMRGRPVGETQELSVARANAAAIREVALGVVDDARDGEVRLSVSSRDGGVEEVFTGCYELSRWSVASSRLPAPVMSRWRGEETTRRRALKAYCRLRDLLAEAAGGGLIRRGMARSLREQIRNELLGDGG